MTGQGRGEVARDGVQVAVEIRGVNRRQAELVVFLPPELASLENKVRDTVGKSVSRGRCDVRVSWQSAAGKTPARINAAMARAYAAEFAALSASLGRAEVASLDLLARLPGVVQSTDEATDSDAQWPALEAALAGALKTFDQTRRREGEALERDLAERIDALRAAVTRVRARSPEVLARYREALVQRIRAAGIEGARADDDRVAKEIVLFADRSDIAEETARLESHFVQWEDCRKATDAVGRKLDFLAQEMNREINTIGSKANDAAISADVVALKTELERFREQAQNIE